MEADEASEASRPVSEPPPRRGWKLKGRGHRGTRSEESEVSRGPFESVEEEQSGPLKSVEGWIVFVTNVHEEAQEDDILDKFGEFGQVKNIHVNLDRRTGFVKGYALIEYAERSEAEAAIDEMRGQDLFGQPVAVDWAFRKSPSFVFFA
ncbi:hypothetical protein CTAYLR_005334 [Chrysophaeum taylorii]|uniref:RNA-binding protein 8A n=1 Tax=Chrysophaeum taylorii TaxID=2483200 RepID=A0AAD7XHA7_9STRA|nr:hypothetical protein CTAYLR_005334 [Chrysophaeum taylorii]